MAPTNWQHDIGFSSPFEEEISCCCSPSSGSGGGPQSEHSGSSAFDIGGFKRSEIAAMVIQRRYTKNVATLH